MPAKEVQIEIPYKDKQTEAVLNVPECGNGFGIILTHGARGDMNNNHIKGIAEYLADHGFLALRFTCKGMNPQYKINVYKTALEYLKDSEDYKLKGVFLSGRAMGCRAAVEIANMKHASYKEYIAGVICLAYPLHEADKTEELRDDALITLKVPTMFIAGDNDATCRKDLMETTVERMTSPAVVQHWIEGGNNQWEVKKKWGTSDEVLDEVYKEVLAFCEKQAGIAGTDKTAKKRKSDSHKPGSPVKEKKAKGVDEEEKIAAKNGVKAKE